MPIDLYLAFVQALQTPPSPEQRAKIILPEGVANIATAVAKLPPRATVPEIVITPRHMPINQWLIHNCPDYSKAHAATRKARHKLASIGRAASNR